jgi:hypothetical protein
MRVRAGRPPRFSDQTDDIAARDFVSHGDVPLALVQIGGRDAVAVVEQRHAAFQEKIIR